MTDGDAELDMFAAATICIVICMAMLFGVLLWLAAPDLTAWLNGQPPIMGR